MTIALVVERFEAHGGGLEQWAWQFAHALAARGHQVRVLAFRADPRPDAAAIEVRLLPWDDSRLARAAAVEEAVRASDADVVHDLGLGWSADVLHPQTGCRLANHRAHLRSLEWPRRLFARMRPRDRRWIGQVRRLEARQFSRRDGVVVAVSRMVAADLAAHHGVTPDRIRIVPNGVDPTRFHPPDPEVRARMRAELGIGDDVLYLFAASNPRLKGFVPLIRAFARAAARRAGLRLVVIGRDADPAMRRLVNRFGLGRAVLFAGRVDDPPAYYAAADVFVLPTYYDACSLTVLEARACGLPVITTMQNGAADLLIDGRDGCLVPDAGDVPALTGAILRLAEADARAAAGGTALDRAWPWTFARNVDAIEAIYRECSAWRPR